MRFFVPGILGGLWGLLCSQAIGGMPGMFATVVGGLVIGVAYGVMRKGKA